MKHLPKSQRFLSAAIAAFFLSAGSALAGGDELINVDPKLGAWNQPLPILRANANNINPGEGEQPMPNPLFIVERSSESEAIVLAEQNQEQDTPPSIVPVNEAPVAGQSGGFSLFRPSTWWGGSNHSSNNNSAAPVVSDKKAEKKVEIDLEALDTPPTLPTIEEEIVVETQTPIIPTTQTASSREGGWGFNLLRLLGFGGGAPTVAVEPEILSEETKDEAADEADETQGELEVFLGNPAYLSERFPTENPVLLDHINTLNGVLETYLDDIIARAEQDNTELTDAEEDNLLTRSMVGNFEHIIALYNGINAMMTTAQAQGHDAYRLAHAVATFIYDFILLKDSKGNIANREAIGANNYFVDHYPTPLPIEETDGMQLTLEQQLEETAALATLFIEVRGQEENEAWDFGDETQTIIPAEKLLNASGVWEPVLTKNQKKRAAQKAKKAAAKALEKAAEY